MMAGLKAVNLTGVKQWGLNTAILTALIKQSTLRYLYILHKYNDILEVQENDQ